MCAACVAVVVSEEVRQRLGEDEADEEGEGNCRLFTCRGEVRGGCTVCGADRFLVDEGDCWREIVVVVVTVALAPLACPSFKIVSLRLPVLSFPSV